MDYTAIFLLASSILICSYVLISQSGRRKSGIASRLPPGPYPLPIIGSIFKLGDKPHHSLTSLSKTYGPIMSLKLGTTPITIVVSSSEIAEEFFHKHDLVFSSRAVPFGARTLGHSEFSMIWLPVGDRWRRLRKASKERMFSLQQLDASRLLREKKVLEFLDHVDCCCASGKAVNISRVTSMATLNVLSNFLFSTDLAYYDSLVSQEFRDCVWGLAEISGTPNLVDIFPELRSLDPLGLLQKGDVYAEKMMATFESLISRRLQARSNYSMTEVPSTSNDVLDALLDASQKNEVSLDEIRHLFFDLFIAGTDTISSTLEWAMAELLHSPEKMAKARTELKGIIRKDDRLVQFSDISRLPYLQAVVKETLRLHPPVPFLIPRQAVKDVEIQGFIVPKGARILCNVWAMGRDSSVWSNPQVFIPERFLDVGINYKGEDFDLFPFGAGRRVCPGLPLAHRMLHVMLGSLIHKFDWKLEGEMRAEDLDMSEKFGITLHKKVPLMAIPIKSHDCNSAT